MNLLKKKNIHNNDRKASTVINLKGHLTSNICLSSNDCLVAVFKIKGISFENKSLDQLISYKTKINNLLRSLNDPSYAIWAYWLRREISINWKPNTDNLYSQMLCEEYFNNLSSNTFQNNYYLSIIYRVFPKKMKSSLFHKVDMSIYKEMILDSIPDFEDNLKQIKNTLEEYHPTILGVDRKSRTSEIGMFYSDVLYGKPHKVPIRNISLSNLVYNRRVLFGREIVEIRHHATTEYAACLALKEYQETTDPTMTTGLNSLPFSFNFVQSFCVIHKNRAKDFIKEQQKKFISIEDDSVSQVSDLGNALDDITAGRILFGEHNATLVLFGKDHNEVARRIADTLPMLEESNAVIVREDIALEGQYLSQLPANYKFRARPSVISSLNFASFIPMFNEPTGRQYGHHWGQALLPLITTNNSIYWLTTHLDDVGSALVLGQTGSGKTVLLSMMLAMLQKPNIKTVFFDKDKGAKLTVLALGGKYHDITYGKNTNFNPFALPENQENISYLVGFVELLAGKLSAEEKMEVSDAISSIYETIEKPRLSSLKTFLNNSPGGLIVRLNDWFSGERYGWVFDNQEDSFSFDKINGIDITDFLDNDDLRTPILSYIFHRIKPLIDGNPIALFLDEFSKMLSDVYFKDWVDNELKVIRKKNGIIIAATQSPSHALNSSIASSIIEQTPTKILLANEYATKDNYTKHLKLTEAEWELFSSMTKSSRFMLIKSGGESGTSIQCRMPLGQSPDVLKILSGTTKSVKRLENIEEANGFLPKDWINQI